MTCTVTIDATTITGAAIPGGLFYVDAAPSRATFVSADGLVADFGGTSVTLGADGTAPLALEPGAYSGRFVNAGVPSRSFDFIVPDLETALLGDLVGTGSYTAPAWAASLAQVQAARDEAAASATAAAGSATAAASSAATATTQAGTATTQATAASASATAAAGSATAAAGSATAAAGSASTAATDAATATTQAGIATTARTGAETAQGAASASATAASDSATAAAGSATAAAASEDAAAASETVAAASLALTQAARVEAVQAAADAASDAEATGQDRVATEAAREAAEAARDSATGAAAIATAQAGIATTQAGLAEQSANEALSVASMVRSVADRATLKALSTAHPAYLLEASRSGTYRYDAAVTIATHQADATEYWYVAPNPAANGAWVRQGAAGLTSLTRPQDVRDLAGKAKSAGVIETVSELTDPTLASNTGRRVILAGQPPIMAYCDGVTWWDLTGGAEIDPWWLPRDAVLHVDFDNSRFYWNGAVRALSDLTVEPVGGYSLSGYGLGFAGTAWVQFEMSSGLSGSGVADWSGTTFSWNAGGPAGNRVEVGVGDNPTFGDAPRLYVSPGNPVADLTALAATSIGGEGGAVYVRNERRRWLVRIKNNTNNRWLPENGDLRDGIRGAGSLIAPTKIGFGMRAAFNDNRLTNATLHRVTIYTKELSAPHIAAVGKFGSAPPVHLLGDSFLNLYGIGTYFMGLCTAADKIVPFSQDGVGGTTLTQQAVRYAAYANTQREKWWDSTLVICEFGQENSAQDQIEALKTILGYIRHDRWLFMQGAPSSALNPVTPLPEKDAIMKAWCGDHFVSTLPEAWAESDGTPTDENQVALGRWPVSLTISAIDFHPNFAGQQFIAQRIYDELLVRGWI
jgi:hypothetical protein